MKILVANNHLNSLGGSETYTYTIIEELKRLNHDVEYFTFKKGIVSQKIEQVLGVSFMSSDKYDIIFANHITTVNELHKKGFIIQTCHGIFPKLEQPNKKADAFVSISQEVQDHLAKLGFASILIHNSINIKRFKPENKINKNIKSILSLCQSNGANTFLRKICKSRNIKFLEVNKFKKQFWEIEKKINEVDLVVGLGRSAYEAMACGRPVIIYDNRPYFESCGDGYAKEILGLSLKNNCSGRYLKQKYNEQTFIQELEKYDLDDTEYFRLFAERELDIVKNIGKYFEYFNFIKKRNEKEKYLKKVAIVKKIVGNKGLIFLVKLKNNFKK